MSGRIRTLKPEWLDDEKLAALPDSARLLSAALILLADDYGNGRAHPLFVASRVWSYGDPHEGLTKVEEGLHGLEEVGFVTLYKVNGQAYFHINNWSRHQKVQHPGKPRVPSPERADSANPPDPEGGDDAPPSGDSHETLTPDHRPRPPITDPDPARARAREHEQQQTRTPKLDPTHLAERYRQGWLEHRGSAPPNVSHWDGRFERAARLVVEQAQLSGQTPDQVLEDFLGRFWASKRAAELGHAPGALASLFPELMARQPGESPPDPLQDELEQVKQALFDCDPADVERQEQLKARREEIIRELHRRKAKRRPPPEQGSSRGGDVVPIGDVLEGASRG